MRHSPWGALRRLVSISTASLALFITGCGGGSTTEAPATSTITGLVQNNLAQPLANVEIQSSDGVVSTGADGHFTITVPTNSSSTAVLLIKKAGFATTAKAIPIAADRITTTVVTLLADQVSSSFAASTGTTLPISAGAMVSISPNSIQTANGSTYSGTVTIAASYHAPDTAEGVTGFAAPYVGMNAGTAETLISAGVIEVKLTDTQGNPLQLRPGLPATLTYPANSVSNGVSSIPLWYYDEANRVWMREGQANKQIDGTYQATVAHFSIWNMDFIGETATLKLCFKDASNKAITDAGVGELRTNGWQHDFLVYSLDGNITLLLVPANKPLEVLSLATPAAFASVNVSALTADEVRELPCIVVTNPPASNAGFSWKLPGTAFTAPDATSTTPSDTTTTASDFAGNYSGTYTGEETGTFAVTIDNTGVVSGTATSTTYAGLVSEVSGTVSDSGAVSLTATSGTAGGATFSGSVTAAGNVSGTWQYVGSLANAGNTFSGQRAL